jgi:nucleotide-binding universal stress UspA family protein
MNGPSESKASASTQEVVEELKQLGQQIGRALKAVWESPERQELEQEVREGLRTLGEQVDEALQVAKERLEAEGIPEQAQRVISSVEKTPVAQEIREALLTGLRALNQELSRLLKKGQSAETSSPSGEEGPS